MMATSPTDAQLRMLDALARCGGFREKPPTGIAHEWSAVRDRFDEHSRTPCHLEMRNFDLVANACVRRGWIAEADDGTVFLTADGRVALSEKLEPGEIVVKPCDPLHPNSVRMTTYAPSTAKQERDARIEKAHAAFNEMSRERIAQGLCGDCGEPPHPGIGCITAVARSTR